MAYEHNTTGCIGFAVVFAVDVLCEFIPQPFKIILLYRNVWITHIGPELSQNDGKTNGEKCSFLYRFEMVLLVFWRSYQLYQVSCAFATF